VRPSVSEFVRCARALVGGETRKDYGFVVLDGTIVYAGDYAIVREHAGDLPTRSFPEDRLIVPGFINGHSHAYQILLRGWADDWPFARWRSEALYKVVPQLTPDDIYWVFTAAFAEMLAAGITSVAEFFYLNGEGNAHAAAAITAAEESGIRLVFARTWMDADYAPPQFRESVDTAQSRTLELMERFPWANVCVAPHSLHAASKPMIRAAADFARSYDCMMHIHVAEAQYEGKETLERFGATPIAMLDELGALDRHTIAIHAIHITEEEKRLLAERDARVIHNPMTNQYLGDGICDASDLQALGVTMGLGTDADVKPSIIDEMRAASLLQKIARLDGGAFGARVAFDLGTAQGARALGLSAGDLIPGKAADYLVLDASRIDPWTPEVQAVVYRGEDRWVQAAFVNGARVYTGEPSTAAQNARVKLKEIAKRVIP
jgi:5-methylthioadenosine/S-adenosylhomocysteine deaminase